MSNLDDILDQRDLEIAKYQIKQSGHPLSYLVQQMKDCEVNDDGTFFFVFNVNSAWEVPTRTMQFMLPALALEYDVIDITTNKEDGRYVTVLEIRPKQ